MSKNRKIQTSEKAKGNEALGRSGIRAPKHHEKMLRDYACERRCIRVTGTFPSIPFPALPPRVALVSSLFLSITLTDYLSYRRFLRRRLLPFFFFPPSVSIETLCQSHGKRRKYRHTRHTRGRQVRPHNQDRFQPCVRAVRTTATREHKTLAFIGLF